MPTKSSIRTAPFSISFMFNKFQNIFIVISIFLISVAFYFIIPYLIAIDGATILNSTILLATFLSILWYTIETNKMQRSIKHQLEVSTTARIVIAVNKDDEFEIVNIGNNTAINIIIADLLISSDEKSIVLRFPSFFYLCSGNKEIFHVKSYVTNQFISKASL